jgi:homoserine O-succinyltransferase
VPIEVQRPTDSRPGGVERSVADPSRSITIGVVNNMPDSALVGTERQFISLLTAAAPNRHVSIRFSCLSEVERAAAAHERIATQYWQLDRLLDEGVDALIVTGSEPRAVTLTDEPYWRALTRLLDRADSELITSLWSCLAAHMAVLHLDGVKRQRLSEKRSGVYQHRIRAAGFLADPDKQVIRTPHSRWNEIQVAQLDPAAYQVISGSDEEGVDTFVSQRRSLLVFCQGHPEYLEDTLLREYRRDINRFLTRERLDYPKAPVGYFGDVAMALVTEFQNAVDARRGTVGIGDFPFDAVMADIKRDWSEDATMLYRNWLAYIAARKTGAL